MTPETLKEQQKLAREALRAGDTVVLGTVAHNLGYRGLSGKMTVAIRPATAKDEKGMTRRIDGFRYVVRVPEQHLTDLIAFLDELNLTGRRHDS